MIRFRLKERMADYSFNSGKRLTLEELAKQTGIHRATLSKIAGPKPCNTETDKLDALCRFFGCPLGDLAEYVPDARGTAQPASAGTTE